MLALGLIIRKKLITRIIVEIILLIIANIQIIKILKIGWLIPRFDEFGLLFGVLSLPIGFLKSVTIFIVDKSE